MSKEKLMGRDDLVNNPAPRIPVCLCLDTSASMRGEKIIELNEGVKYFYKSISEDEIAVYSAEISIVTFDSDARQIQRFKTLEKSINTPDLQLGLATFMGEGVNMSLDLLEQRKEEYKEVGVDYYQPWLVLMTDGMPNGNEDEFKRAIKRTHELVESRKLTVFPIGIGNEASKSALREFSPEREPLKLKGLNFKAFFKWLSQSISTTSQSIPGENIPLDKNGLLEWIEPKGWDEGL